MWFSNAIGSDKIKFMFNDELKLADIVLVDFLIGQHADLKLRFLCKNLPAKIPKKWSLLKVNSMFLTVTFGDVFESEIFGYTSNIICSPNITTAKDRAEITIENEEFKLNCISRFLTIEDISPCLE